MSSSRNAPCPCGSGKKYKRCCGQCAPAASVAGQKISIEQLFDDAVQCYQQGDLGKAESLADTLLQKMPANAQVLELGAAIAMQKGDAEKAQSMLQKQLKQMPDNANVQSNLCMVLHAMGRDDEAYVACRKAIEINSELAEAYNNLGNIYKARHHLEDALSHYNRAIELGVSDPRVYINAGQVSQLLGDVETAENRYREVLKHLPDFAPALNNLGMLQMKMGHLDEALQTLEKVQSGELESINNMGAVLLEMSDIEGARKRFMQVLEVSPEHVGAIVNLGLADEEEGQTDDARKRYQQALRLDPGSADAHYNLAASYSKDGWQEEAIEQYSQALKSEPNFARAMAGLGEALLRQDQAAPELIDKAMELAPSDPLVRWAHARQLSETGSFDEARNAWNELIALSSTKVDGYIGLAQLYESHGDYNAARDTYQHGGACVEDKGSLYRSWSVFEESTHNLDKAIELAEKAAELSPDYQGVTVLRAKLARRGKDYQQAIALLTQVNIESISDAQSKSQYEFELAANYDKLGQYDLAFQAYQRANEYKNQFKGRVYDVTKDEREQNALRECFSAQNWSKLSAVVSGKSQGSFTPLFIVGFPRSGTSLLEQILGSHQQIAPAGELNFIDELASPIGAKIIGSNKSWPEFMLDEGHPITSEALQKLRDYYLESVEKLGLTGNGVIWVSDKMPHNILNLGLISLLFPQSPIIHISRHPLDSCLSAYYANFASKHRYTSSLEATATHYRNVMETLEHYKRALDMKFLEIHYEDLVQDQEQITRQVLEFIGAPWDERCLQHHKSERVVRTASYEQVTQKIYRSSLYRYRNYWKHVEPIIPILKETIERYGYEVE